MVKVLLGCNMNGRIPQDSMKRALQFASRYGRIEVVRCIVECGADVDSLTAALYEAVNGNYVEIAALLIDNGADYNASSTYRASSWILTCGRGSPAMVRLMLDHGADPNAVDANGWSLLRVAISYSEVLKLLLEHGADPNLADTTTGETPLMRAAIYRCVNIVNLLLEYNADVTQENWDGKSVLDMLGHEIEVDKDNVGAYNDMIELCTQYIDRRPVLK